MTRERSLHTFALTLRLGNAAMSTPEDVADTLEGLAATLRKGLIYPTYTLRDPNGNTVGSVAASWPKQEK